MLPFVGPSYVLADGDASRARTVNLYLQGMESPSKAQFILRSIPGLTTLSTVSAVVRGSITAAGRLFIVAGTTLYEVSSAGVATSRGTLSTSTGEVSMAFGVAELVIVDGPSCYTLMLATNVFATNADVDFLGASHVDYAEGFFAFLSSEGDYWFINDQDDSAVGYTGLAFDAAEFKGVTTKPDDGVALLVSHREIIVFGELSIERFFNSGNATFPFDRDSGATADVGCLAPRSVAKLDNGVMWIGQDSNGSGLVYRDVNRTPTRVSTIAVEEALQGSTDLSDAVAYVYQKHGFTFYAINAPGLSATWVYEVSTGTWHERCDLDGNGNFEALRVTHTGFAYGKHFAFDATGAIYEMDDEVFTLGGDPLKRSRTSPHDVTPLRDRKSYSEFVLDCTTGVADQAYTPFVEVSWSNDGGATFGNPVLRNIGAVGDRYPRVIVQRCGMSRDRVWRVECSAPVEFSIINAETR